MYLDQTDPETVMSKRLIWDHFVEIIWAKFLGLKCRLHISQVWQN